MSVNVAPAITSTPIDDQLLRLHGRWLVVARVTWLVIALLTGAYFVASLPHAFVQFKQACAGPACPFGAFSPEHERELTAMGFSADFFAGYRVVLAILAMLVSSAIGSAIFWLKSDDRMALFVGITLVTSGALTVVDSLDATATSSIQWWLYSAVIFTGNIGLIVSWLLFPNGRFVPRWTRWLAGLLVALGIAFHFFPDSPIYRVLVSPFGAVLSLGIVGSAVGSQIYRYRHVSNTLQRQQTKWAVFGIALGMAGSQGVSLIGPFLGQLNILALLALHTIASLSLLLIPLSIGVAILRYRLWDIDPLINRALVYGALTASVVAIYVFVVGYLGAIFAQGRPASGSLAISLVATGLVAVLFQPLRDRLQRGINRLLYGARDEPYAVLAQLGQRLESTQEPDAVLPTIVESVRDALKLPYVAIILDQGPAATFAAAVGTPVADLLTVRLAYQGAPIGQLLLGPRGPGETFSAADRRLIEVLARQAGVAAHAVRLTADLQRSREQIVLAREEERRRLRNDLHDGLGPQLASLTLKIQTARLRLAHDPLADTLLTDLVGRTQAAVADIRRVVYALRPPALDELGLLSALREVATLYSTPGASDLLVHVDAPDQLPPLAAAVEVAAYRIAHEALTNVVKHAQAHTCSLRLTIDEQAGVLCIEVQDDGQGVTPGHAIGVGLHSMRERAAELGGTLIVEPVAAGGTLLSARLPLRVEHDPGT